MLTVFFSNLKTAAYKHGDGKKIEGRRVLVDVERGRTVKGWLPRRLGKPHWPLLLCYNLCFLRFPKGGGLGDSRKPAEDERDER